MKKEEITQGNKLIAEFMGAPGDLHWLPQHKEPYIFQGVFYDYDEQFRSNELKYHLSWDWLIPVVKECWDIINTFDYDSEEYFYLTEEIFHIDYSLNEFMEADIKSVYERVIDFITWYNENYLNE